MIRLLLFISLLSVACHKDKDERTDPPTQESTIDSAAGYPVIKTAAGLQYHTGLLHAPDENKGFGDSHMLFTDCGPLPDEFDLRKLGLVPPVRDQGNCGSCWSFSKTGSLESALLGIGKSIDLSEQEMVSCDRDQYGCNGGLLSSFSYQIDKGQGVESDFPYTARNGTCKNIPKAAKGVSFQYVGTADRGPNEQELKCALYKFKTIPWITVGATSAWGSPPSSERTPYTRCGMSQTNHAVGVVGWWKDPSGKTQFIMKNSWGDGWGDKGYMSLPIGCNNFGEEVAFVEVEKPIPPTPTPGPGPSPTPSPIPPCDHGPKVKLPAEVQVFGGTEVMIGVKAEQGVSYVWSVDGVQVGVDAAIMISPPKDAVYKLTAKNDCAIAEALVRVRIVMSKQ